MKLKILFLFWPKVLLNIWGDVMKRLIVDAIFILVLVSLGSSLQNTDKNTVRDDLDGRIKSFEEDVALHREINDSKDIVKLNDITENKASSFARETSDIIIDIMDTSLSVVSEVFQGILD